MGSHRFVVFVPDGEGGRAVEQTFEHPTQVRDEWGKIEQALEIDQALGTRAGLASGLHMLGNPHYLKSEYPQAKKRHNGALAILQELGHE